MKAMKIKSSRLKGEIIVPPSKSDAHRAVICASLSTGKSLIHNIDISKDILSTIEAMRKLGAEIEIIKDGKFNKLSVKGSDGYIEKQDINCRESGSTLRFLIPIMLYLSNGGTIRGEGKLVERPLNIYYEMFKNKEVEYRNNNGNLPLEFTGELKSGNYEMRGDVSSQFITGLLFVLPLLKGDSVLRITTELQSKGYVDLTLKVLKAFGIEIINKDYTSFTITGNQKYKSTEYKVEGDYSQSAFWMVAGVLGEEIKVQSLRENSVQGDKVITSIIREMGGKIKVGDEVTCSESSTKGMVIDVKECPDLAPILTVLGALSSGTTYIVNGERLRIKESDRLKSISTELIKMGADIKERKDSLEIRGVKELKGAEVDSWNDHRIAMALAVASIKCRGEIILTGFESVSKSYPHFWEDFKSLGGITDECYLGK